MGRVAGPISRVSQLPIPPNKCFVWSTIAVTITKLTTLASASESSSIAAKNFL